MKIKANCVRLASLILALCLLPLSGFAKTSGLADSDALAYDTALTMLANSSKTDVDKLEDIRKQLVQAGTYQLGIEYLTFVEALLLLQGVDEDRFDKALDSIQRLSKNKGFALDYYGQLDKSGRQALPDLEKLFQYIGARKLEDYGDRESAIALYDAYPVLDAVTRAGNLTNAIRKEKYDQAIGLLSEGSLQSVQQAAGLFSELGGYRDSVKRLLDCQARIAELATPNPTTAPTPIPTAKPTPTPAIAVLVPVFYKSLDGTVLYKDQVTYLAGSKNTYHANDAFVPAGYKLSGSRDVSISVSANGTVNPANIWLTYEKPITVGSTVYFGEYEQDNNLSNGKEKISWRVLAIEDDKALLISEKNLDCQPYNTELTSVTWETCTLRKWLNSTFFEVAFSNFEMNVIEESLLENVLNNEYSTPGGESTWDRVFLLSVLDAEQYFNGDADRIAYTTSFAITRGTYSSDEGWGSWWLRSPGASSRSASHVHCPGTVIANGDAVHDGYYAVRPALWVNLDSGIF